MRRQRQHSGSDYSSKTCSCFFQKKLQHSSGNAYHNETCFHDNQNACGWPHLPDDRVDDASENDEHHTAEDNRRQFNSDFYKYPQQKKDQHNWQLKDFHKQPYKDHHKFPFPDICLYYLMRLKSFARMSPERIQRYLTRQKFLLFCVSFLCYCEGYTSDIKKNNKYFL